MQVTAWKNIDLEVEVDVGIDEVIAECHQRADEATETYWRRVAPAINAATKFLAAVKDEVIRAFPVKARQEIRKRLLEQLERYPEETEVQS